MAVQDIHASNNTIMSGERELIDEISEYIQTPTAESQPDIEQSLVDEFWTRPRVDDQVEQPELPMPNWKPKCFSPLYLLLLCSIHVGYIGVLEYLIQKHASPESWDIEETSGAAAIQFLPVLFVVVLGMFWEVIDMQVRRLEPFHKLARPEGATMAQSLSIDYTSGFAFFVPFQALYQQDFAVALSSTIFLFAAGVLPALSASMTEAILRYELISIYLDPTYMRVVQGFNAAIVLLTLILLRILTRRTSGLMRAPAGIADLASLICESNVVGHFQNIGSCESRKVIKKTFGNQIFRLAYCNKQKTYQIIVSEGPTPQLKSKHNQHQSPLESRPFVLWRRSLVFVNIITAIPLLINEIDARLGQDTMAPWIKKILLTAAASLISLTWQAIHRELCAIAPFRRLCQFPKNVPEDQRYRAINYSYIGLSPFMVLSKALKEDSHLVIGSGICSFLSQIFSIFFPPILSLTQAALSSSRLGTDSRVMKSLLSSLYAVGAFAWLCNLFVVIWTIRYLRYARPFLPRQPNTIASQLLYICNSKTLLADCKGTSMMSTQEFEKHLQIVKGEYRLGWFKCETGESVVGIEREPYPQGYKYSDKESPYTTLV